MLFMPWQMAFYPLSPHANYLLGNVAGVVGWLCNRLSGAFIRAAHGSGYLLNHRTSVQLNVCVVHSGVENNTLCWEVAGKLHFPSYYELCSLLSWQDAFTQ